MNEIVFRKATPNDAQPITDLVNLGAGEKQLLPRSLEYVRASIENWIVAAESSRIVGVGSLFDLSPILAEVRSLVVAPEHRQNGIGADIVNRLMDEAHARGISTVFALTRAVSFFEKQGFAVTAKENFPEKVWRDCMTCSLQDACDEVAVVKTVGSRQSPDKSAIPNSQL